MLENLPLYLTIGFGLTTMLAVAMVALLTKTSSKRMSGRHASLVILTIVIWLSVQAVLSIRGISPHLLSSNLVSSSPTSPS